MEKGKPYSWLLTTFRPEDRAILAAVLMEKADRCEMCGLPEWEFHEDPDAYQAMQVVCPWCAMRDRARADVDTDKTIPGGRVKLISKGTVQRILNQKVRRPKSRRERKRERAL